MWYVILFIVLCWVLYKSKPKIKKHTAPSSDIQVSIVYDNSGWEERKKEKADSLVKLQKEFVKPSDIKQAVSNLENAVKHFVDNHDVSYEEIQKNYQKLALPEDLKKREAFLRKQIASHYKDRNDKLSKTYAIYLAFQHLKLLAENPNNDWKNFSGLQKIQTNLKAEEYFEALIGIMFAHVSIFKNTEISQKISDDIQKTFELWNSRNIYKKIYEDNISNFPNAKRASDKHFTIIAIIDYLERRYKFNPRFKSELTEWCLKDIPLYEDFLKEFHDYKFGEFNSRGEYVRKIYTFDDVKALKEYMVPRLVSFEMLWEIYESDNNQEKLKWLSAIASHIKYGNFEDQQTETPVAKPIDSDLLERVTTVIEVKKSGAKGKLAFLNSKDEMCSTENAYKDYMERNGFYVMRAEVSFWQAMFCFCFWEEIFNGMGNPEIGSDIPHDLFQGNQFYSARKKAIDEKFEHIKNIKLKSFINQQKTKYRNHWTRLVYNGDQDLAAYFDTEIVQTFLDRIDSGTFSKIVYRISQNPNEHRSGVSDFVVWDEKILKMVETKGIREKIRESQISWIEWMVEQRIPVEIARIKGIQSSY